MIRTSSSPDLHGHDHALRRSARSRRRTFPSGINNYDGLRGARRAESLQWTFPIVYSPHDPKRAVRRRAEPVFRSTDEGTAGRRSAPTSRVHDPTTLGAAGGPITYDMTGTEWYATVFALRRVAASTADVLWAGSDDGLIHVSRDRGDTWTNVTPPALAKFTRDLASSSRRTSIAGTAYVAANRYQLDDFKPYLFKTTDLRQDVDENHHRHSRRRVHARDSRGSGAPRTALSPARRPASTTPPTTARTGSRCSSTCRARRCAT